MVTTDPAGTQRKIPIRLDSAAVRRYPAGMRWLPLLLLLLPAGCASAGGQFVVPPESALRLPLREKLTGMVQQCLKRDGWTGTVATSETTGVLATQVSEGWFEDRVVIDVTAHTPDGEPFLIPAADYSPVLTAVRKKLVTFVESEGGVAVDWWTIEAHGERTLVFLYRHEESKGTLRLRVRPRADDRPEELVTRFEMTLREQ